MKQRNQRGITLIALVITIIVLLILAGITITLLMGDNGVLNRASVARIKTEQGLILEQLRIEMYGKKIDVENKQNEIDYLKDKQIVESIVDTDTQTITDVLTYGYIEKITNNTLTGKGNVASGDIYYISNGDLYYKDANQESTNLGELFIGKDTDNKQDLKWIYHENEEGNIVITGIDLSDFSYMDEFYFINVNLNREILIVPSQLEGKKVVSLSFYVQDFIFPAKPQNRYDWEFATITGVKKIVYGDTIEKIENIGISFRDVKTLELPENLKEIGDDAFYRYNCLSSIVIPSGVTSIGDCAFYECNLLTDVDIPEGVTYIGNNVFDYCYNLDNINLPKSVTHIGNRTFYYVTVNFKNGKNDALEIPEDRWGAREILINGVKY